MMVTTTMMMKLMMMKLAGEKGGVKTEGWGAGGGGV